MLTLKAHRVYKKKPPNHNNNMQFVDNFIIDNNNDGGGFFGGGGALPPPNMMPDLATMYLRTFVIQKRLALDNGSDAFDYIKNLLDQGADPNVQCDETGDTFLHNVLSHYYHVDNNRRKVAKLFDFFKLFIRSPHFNQYIVNNKGDAIIHKAAHMPPFHFLKLYLSEKAGNNIDVNIQDRGNNTALRIVCNTGISSLSLRTGGNTGTPKIIKLLLQAGANPNIANKLNFTPIFDVCHHMKLYVRSGVNPLQVIQMLLEARANPNIKPTLEIFEGRSCLHQLATECDLPLSGQICTILLMSSDAKLNAIDIHGRTPLDMAQLCDNIYVIDAINKFNQRNFSVTAMNHPRLAEGPSRGLSDELVKRIWDHSLDLRYTDKP